MKNRKLLKKRIRKLRIRAKIKGSKNRPRLSVYRSNKYIYAQLIDDRQGKTLAFVGEKNIKDLKEKKETKTQRAFAVGEYLASFALRLGIKEVVFDRNGYKFHGRVKALASGARKGGLKF